jgi:hypothetical protein
MPSLVKKGRRAAGNRTGRARQSMVGLAPTATNVSTRQRTSVANDGHSCRFKGTDFVSSVSSGTGLVAGQVLLTLAANPRMIGVSRLAIASSVWERFKFRSLKFHYAPIANATQTGSLIGYVDYDVNDVPTGTGDANLQRAWAHYGQQSCQIWGDPSKHTVWELKDVDPLTDLYIDSPSEDPHWTSQGRFVLLSASTVAASLPLGNIFVEYDVEFFIPQIEQSPVAGTGELITGGGTMSAANVLGDASTTATWSNLTVSRALNVLSLPAGSYLLVGDFVGTGLAYPAGVWFTTTGTNIGGNGEINAAATHFIQYASVYSAAPFTVTLGFTATTVSASALRIVLLPSLVPPSSTSSQLLSLALELKQLKAMLEPVTITSSSSTSSVSSSSMGSFTSNAVRSGWFKV